MTNEEREAKLKKKAETGVLCFSEKCPQREHCILSLLNQYASKEHRVRTSVNLNNPLMQTADCPLYLDSEPVHMAVGIAPIYDKMPGKMERKIKHHLIDVYTRKLYYDYHTGRRPMPPEVERYVRQTARAAGWEEELLFDHYTDDFAW